MPDDGIFAKLTRAEIADELDHVRRAPLLRGFSRRTPGLDEYEPLLVPYPSDRRVVGEWDDWREPPRPRLKADVTATELEWLGQQPHPPRYGEPGSHLYDWPQDGNIFHLPPPQRTGLKWVRAGLLIEEAFDRSAGEPVPTSDLRALLDQYNERCEDPENNISWSTVMLQLHEKKCKPYRPKGSHGKYAWSAPKPVTHEPGVPIEHL